MATNQWVKKTNIASADKVNFGHGATGGGITPASGNFAASSTYNAAPAKPKVTLDTQYKQRQTDTQNQINKLYDTQYKTQAANLKRDYDQNLSKAQADLAKIAPQYQNQANNLAVNYEQQRRNANLSAMNSGMATGTQLQQQNAYNTRWLDTYGNLRGEEANAINTANQGIADLTTAYNNSLADARANINTKRDQALIEAQRKDREWYERQVETAAKYGDFSGYRKLYGDAQAKAAQNAWTAKNPDLAYRMGMINAKEYRKLTGKDPNTK